MTSLYNKAKRLNIVDLKKNHPEDFGRFVMALKHLEDSDDWYRICGIHGNTFKPNDPQVLCPTDPNIVKELAETGEPVYCKHSVPSFIAWHVPYIYQFELLLNKYNHSNNKNYIALPYLDLTIFNSDFSFLNDPKITIIYNNEEIIIDNPLASAYYYVDGVKTKITRSGYLTPTNKAQLTQLTTIKKQLNNTLYALYYEKFSSQLISYEKLNKITTYFPLETPHNSLHDVIGGDNGNMSDISISAFDPIFWLHHCNMDRHFYTWLYENTNHFNCSIYPEKISEPVYNSTQAPFFQPKFNDKYGWENSSKEFMLLKDTLNVNDLPYTYDIIQPTPYKEVTSFIELIDIPIPMETLTISVYIYLKNEELNKDIHFAGSGTWFGLNRINNFCERCEVTRTNIKIDLDEYINENNITKDTLDNYNIVVEGRGRLIKKENNYSTYSLEEIINDGSYAIII